MDRRTFLRTTGQGLGLLCLGPLTFGCSGESSDGAVGDGTAAEGVADGPGYDPGPYSVGEDHLVFDANSSAFILDVDDHTIHDLDDAQSVEGSFASLGDDPGELNHPVAAVVHGDRLLVLDRGNARVQVFDQAGRPIGVIGDGLHMPRGLAAEGGQVFICDTLNHRVMVFDLEGKQLRAIGGGDGASKDGLNAPVDVAVGSDGNLHVLDSGHARVLVFSPEGDRLMSYGHYGSGEGEMKWPGSLIIHPDGRVFITDATAGFVHVFDQEGAFLGRFRPVDESGQLVAPVRVSVTHEGELYIWTDGHLAA